MSEYEQLLAIARDVVMDYGHHCDNPAHCECSMARLARHIGAVRMRGGFVLWDGAVVGRIGVIDA